MSKLRSLEGNLIVLYYIPYKASQNSQVFGQTSKKLQYICFVVQHIPNTLFYRVTKPENSTSSAKPDFGVKNADLEEKSLKTGNCVLHIYLYNIWNNNGKNFF